MNEETRDYWPDEDEFASDYVDEEFSIDVELGFDVVRANIGNSNLNKLIRRSCELGLLPPSQTKWTLRELDFISGSVKDNVEVSNGQSIFDFSE